jgi:hypothetical protein
VTIYDYDAKSKNILKSGFLRKKIPQILSLRLIVST